MIASGSGSSVPADLHCWQSPSRDSIMALWHYHGLLSYKVLLQALTLKSVALEKKLQLLFKTILHHDALS